MDSECGSGMAIGDGGAMDRAPLHEVVRALADFQGGMVGRVSEGHVQRWLAQFDPDVRTVILQELAYVLRRTYFSRSRVQRLLEVLAGSSLSSQEPPAQFWNRTALMDLYLPEHSQSALLTFLRELLHSRYGREAGADRPAAGRYLYLDDFLMSGSRVIEDLRTWVSQEAAPSKATVHLVFLAVHTHGLARAEARILALARQAGKELALQWWHAERIEDHPAQLDVADVLRPAAVPDDRRARAYFRAIVDRSPPGWLRIPGRLPVTSVFSSEVGRSMLEQQLTVAGLWIRDQFEEPEYYMRPLGFQGLPSFGFGTLVASYRNCPNHCPLAIWFGDPSGGLGHPWDRWYPLIPRRLNQQLEEAHGLAHRVFQYPPPDQLASGPVSRRLPTPS
jgi:hypothetical protein